MKKKIVSKISPVNKITHEKLSPNNSFYIVGIGASAGGLDAFERFFKTCPIIPAWRLL